MAGPSCFAPKQEWCAEKKPPISKPRTAPPTSTVQAADGVCWLGLRLRNKGSTPLNAARIVHPSTTLVPREVLRLGNFAHFNKNKARNSGTLQISANQIHFKRLYPEFLASSLSLLRSSFGHSWESGTWKKHRTLPHLSLCSLQGSGLNAAQSTSQTGMDSHEQKTPGLHSSCRMWRPYQLFLKDQEVSPCTQICI